jgi:para-nitrobenzyl esterase
MSTIAQDVIVATTRGKVRGAWTDGVASFRGIPYAAAPFGPNRLLAPKPPEAWDGVRDALTNGPIPPQAPYPPAIYQLLGEQGVVGEDCLNLNVWTSDPSPDAHLPVMVWIPGGAFARGAGSLPVYDGGRFARDGVVCVTINYRLGVDGFLHLVDAVPNRGLLDQVAALGWVQGNIEAFGGDPGNVTIFGESAGAFSVGTLLAMPAASGLFGKAILQSGAAQHTISIQTAEMVRDNLMQALGLEPTIGAISNVPLPQLITAQATLAGELLMNPDPARWGETALNGMMFEPVVDGDTLPARPIDRVREGATAGIDLMVGNTAEEWRFFIVPTGLLDLVTDQQLQFFSRAYGLPGIDALGPYRTSMPDASQGDLLAALITDWFFRIPALRLAEAHAANGGTPYVYELAWRSPMFGGRLGACHALEIGFVFDNLDKSGPMVGSNPPQSLATAMHNAWVEFARSANPGWQPYSEERRVVMRYADDAGRVVVDPSSDQRRLWQGLR